MRPDHLELLNSVSTPAVHPTEGWAVTAVSRPDFDTDSYVGQLWRVEVDGTARRITRGRADRAPQFSPDGALIGFLRAVDGKPQLALVRAEGGEPMVVTDAKLGVSAFCFSPDSAKVAYTTRVPVDGRYGTDPDIPASAEDPRHFTGNRLQSNGLGWADGRPSQVFWLPTPDVDAEPLLKPIGRAKDADAEGNPEVPASTRLTHDEISWSQPTFTPDGMAIVVVGDAHAGRENDLVSDLYRIPLKGGRPKRLTNTGRPKNWISASDPTFSADGEHLFFVGRQLGAKGLDFVGNHGGVWLMPAAGGEPTRLTDPDVTVFSGLRPSARSGVLFAEEHRGHARLLKATPSGAEVLDHSALSVQGAASGGGEVWAAVDSATSTGELAVLKKKGLKQVTDFGAAMASEMTIVEPVEVTHPSRDGYPVHGWVLKPAGEGPHPVLLNIHGGPYAAYNDSFFDEWQVYVEAGYAVVACNPRGSASYGTEHGRAIRGDMGNLDMVDILSFLDASLAADPSLDAERVGIMGGSYGGYMTAWIIGQDHRWAGAIVERGFLDPEAFIGSSDIGWFFPLEYNGREMEQLRAQSPMRFVDEVTTPTLVLHSEEDLRCPLAQGLTYYGRLKNAGVDAEILIFPGENHELSRSGRPWHRRQRFEKILEFWDRHLPVKAAKKASGRKR